MGNRLFSRSRACNFVLQYWDGRQWVNSLYGYAAACLAIGARMREEGHRTRVRPYTDTAPRTLTYGYRKSPS